MLRLSTQPNGRTYHDKSMARSVRTHASCMVMATELSHQRFMNEKIGYLFIIFIFSEMDAEFQYHRKFQQHLSMDPHISIPTFPCMCEMECATLSSALSHTKDWKSLWDSASKKERACKRIRHFKGTREWLLRCRYYASASRDGKERPFDLGRGST